MSEDLPNLNDYRERRERIRQNLVASHSLLRVNLDEEVSIEEAEVIELHPDGPEEAA